RALQVQHLEKAREAVAEHLARKDPVEEQQDEAAGDEGQGDAAVSKPGSLPLEEPGAAANGGAKDDVARRPEDAGHHRQRDRPGALGLALQHFAPSQRLRHSKHIARPESRREPAGSTAELALAACGRLGRVEFFAPALPSHGLVFLFSDAGGWSAPLEQVARRLVARGAAVVGVDLRRYLDALARSADGCHYVVADLEELSHRLERETDFLRYRSPVLAGLGAGATLAYAALAQAPAATIAGAAGIDPAPALATRVPLCRGAAATPDPAGFRYATGVPLPGPWRIRTARGSDAAAALVDLVTPLLEPPAPGGSVAAALADLPLVEVPAPAPGPLGAVL